MSLLFSFLHDEIDSHRECAGQYNKEERLAFFQQFFVWIEGAFHCRKWVWTTDIGCDEKIRKWACSILEEGLLSHENPRSLAIRASVMSMFDDDELRYVRKQMYDILECDFADGPETSDE